MQGEGGQQRNTVPLRGCTFPIIISLLANPSLAGVISEMTRERGFHLPLKVAFFNLPIEGLLICH